MFSRRIVRSLVISGAVVGALSAGDVRAQQIDTNPPTPNVLLLIDNSGSMERMIDGSIPEASPANACNCNAVSGVCNWTQTPQANRWNLLQQSLTGTLANGFNCVAMPRTPNSVFTSEYTIAGQLPYDTNYYLNYHRMVGQDTSSGIAVPCVIAPGVLPGASSPNGVGSSQGFGGGGLATDYTGGIIKRQYNQLTSSTSTCQFTQLQDGFVNTMTDLMRFGLMTFDQDPSGATGTSGTTPSLTAATNQACDPSGICGSFAGMWSYFPGWNTGAACPYQGNPVNCMSSTLMGVGARNPAAPPWEGRMVQFPSTNDIATQESSNSNVSQVVLASRAYGATPMAGMLTQAKYYLTTDPSGPQQSDPYVSGGCRPEFIIIITDGAPNDDMRPDCATTTGTPPGVCPFDLPYNITTSLYNMGAKSGSQQFVTTYVIGFAVSSFTDGGTLVNCSTLATNGTLATICGDPKTGVGPTDPLYAPCCELQSIAVAGGSQQAYFADSTGDLQAALGSILASIASHATTRTVPAYSQSFANNTYNSGSGLQTASEVFLASFNPTSSTAGGTSTTSTTINSGGVPWSGDIQRQRTDCSSSAVPVAQTISTSAGDDFADDLNSAIPTNRYFIAVEPSIVTGNTTVQSAASVRPYAVSTVVQDGLTPTSILATGTQYSGTNPPVNVIPNITPDALGITTTGTNPGCAYSPIASGGTNCTSGGTTCYLTPTDCRTMLLDYTDGQTFAGPSNFPWTSRTTDAFGDIFHATPAVVGPPASVIQDPSYVNFKAWWTGTSSETNAPTTPRKQVVYAATNDGLLHAFWADETTKENNEMWAMMPPAVMPNILSSYPSSHQFLLDGSPIVKDVVWDRTTANIGTETDWHTMLVAGFGPYQKGYYGVDVTNPDPSNLAANSSTTVSYASTGYAPGPVFRWQLTTMPSTNFQIFADHSATPAVTTLFFDPVAGDSGSTPHEIGVALLSGGVASGGATSTTVSCARTTKSTDAGPPTGYPYRTNVRCWGANQLTADPVPGRSLAVVRLDTGEIIRVFGRLADFPTTDTLRTHGLVTDTPLDSPMTGTPIVYPLDVGTTATKAFVADADGTMWRFDFSSPDPSQWVGQLYLDLYNTNVDVPTSTGSTWNDGQPAEVPPVASLDTNGNLVLNVATGSVEKFDTTGNYYVYSITEKVQASGSVSSPRAFVNWWFGPQSSPDGFQQGERVSGPMAVFNGVLYFSSYYAGTTGSSCNPGDAYLRGFDFVKPADTSGTCTANNDCANGGIADLTSGSHNYEDSTALGTAQGAVIPGVSIMASPPCSILGTASNGYFGSSHQAPSTFNGGSFSLFAQVGASGGAAGTAAQNVTKSLPSVTSPATIDSWASVLE